MRVPPLRRHPSAKQLETWFDGEAQDSLAWHIAICGKCFAHVDRISRLRAAVRGGLAFESLEDLEADGLELDDPALAFGAPDLPQPPMGLADERGEWTPPPLGADLSDSSLADSGPSDRGEWTPPPVRLHRRLSPLTVAAAAAILLLGLIVGAGAVHLHGTLSSALGNGGGESSAPSAPGEPSSRSGRPVTRAEGSTSPEANQSTGPSGPGGSPLSGAPGAIAGSAGGAQIRGSGLILGLVVPTSGPYAPEGLEVERAAQQAVAEANATGGVDGSAVQLIVVSAQSHPASILEASHVSAMVGGFATTPVSSLPWIMPADPDTTGTQVVATELSARDAGARLGAQLVHGGLLGTVGVIEGTGPDVALSTGIAEELPVTNVDAPDNGTCPSQTVMGLEQQHPDALAVAGPPSLALACVDEIDALGWQGPILFAPSAAYSSPGSTGVTMASPNDMTVLGLPWPQSSSPGAQRFRTVVPGDTSYRALVSFAAVEMAVDVARTSGDPTPAAVAAGNWHNDLFDYAGGTNVGAQVVQAGPDGWTPVSSGAQPPSAPTTTQPPAAPSIATPNAAAETKPIA